MRPGLTFRAEAHSVKPASFQELSRLAGLFLRLGVTAFGGPAAHIALMEREFVSRRQWLTHDEFLDLLGATNLIPGPNSTEMALHIGHRRAGWAGLLVAGICFILPAAVIVGALAWAYVRFGRLPQVAAVLYGIKPVMIAVIVQALWRLGRSALKSVSLGVLAAVAIAAVAAGINELAVLAAAGIVAAAPAVIRRRPGGTPPSAAVLGVVPGALPVTPPSLLAPLGAAAAVAASAPFSFSALFFVFLKMGSVLFGSGYVLLAYMRADLVNRLGWLSEAQLLDAITVGQVTPGPVFTTATFVGYLIGGATGGAVATVAIFLPAFVFVAASGPLVPRLRRSKLAGAFLDGVNVASLALMAVVTARLGASALVDVPTLGLAAASGLILLRYGGAATWLVLGGGLAGVLLGR